MQKRVRAPMCSRPRTMSRSIRSSAILLACCLTTACTSLTLRAPACTPPPIPVNLLQPCQVPQPLSDGKFATLYQQSLADQAPWSECRRRQEKLAEVAKYQQTVCNPSTPSPSPSSDGSKWNPLNWFK